MNGSSMSRHWSLCAKIWPVVVNLIGAAVKIRHLARYDQDEALGNLTRTPGSASRIQQLVRFQARHAVGVRIKSAVPGDDHDLAEQIHTLRQRGGGHQHVHPVRTPKKISNPWWQAHAAALAAMSNVKQLVLTHISGRYEDDEILAEARKMHPKTRLAMDFDRIVI
jgi:phosphoribosyl 1,2-cyclic phosphodiesterase